MSKIYILMASRGEWSDNEEWVIEAYTDQKAAQAKAEKLEAKSLKSCAEYEFAMNMYDVARQQYEVDIEKFNNGKIKKYPIEPEYPYGDTKQTYYYVTEHELIG